MTIIIEGTEEQKNEIERKLNARFPNIVYKNESLYSVVTKDQVDRARSVSGAKSINDYVVTLDPSANTRLVDFDANTPEGNRAALESFAKGHVDFVEPVTSSRDGRLAAALIYLRSAFVYGLQISDADMAEIKAIVDRFDPKKANLDEREHYERVRLEKHGMNVVRTAPDLEAAFATMDKLGLRQKLVAMGDAKAIGSMSWWMNKEPLRSKPVGQGTGKTARDLGITRVTHGTRDFKAYESITAPADGKMNFLISRANVAGESAAYGNGVYAGIGRNSQRSDTALGIEMDVKPDAKLGTDFHLPANGLFLLVNKDAVTEPPRADFAREAADSLTKIAEQGDLLTIKANAPVIERLVRSEEKKGLLAKTVVAKLYALLETALPAKPAGASNIILTGNLLGNPEGYVGATTPEEMKALLTERLGAPFLARMKPIAMQPLNLDAQIPAGQDFVQGRNGGILVRDASKVSINGIESGLPPEKLMIDPKAKAGVDYTIVEGKINLLDLAHVRLVKIENGRVVVLTADPAAYRPSTWTEPGKLLQIDPKAKIGVDYTVNGDHMFIRDYSKVAWINADGTTRPVKVGGYAGTRPAPAALPTAASGVPLTTRRAGPMNCPQLMRGM